MTVAGLEPRQSGPESTYIALYCLNCRVGLRQSASSTIESGVGRGKCVARGGFLEVPSCPLENLTYLVTIVNKHKPPGFSDGLSKTFQMVCQGYRKPQLKHGTYTHSINSYCVP